MAENQQHAFSFASPELHWLNKYPGTPSHSFKWNALMQNTLISVPVNRDDGNASKPSGPSPHLSHEGSPSGKEANKKKQLIFNIIKETSIIACATTIAPIERVYMLMQCQNEMIKAGRLSTPYKGMTDCLRRTIKHEGVISLWRGNCVSVISLCLKQAFPIALFARLPYMDYMTTKMKESPLWILPFMVMPVMLCHYPFEYARVRLATDVVKAGGNSRSLLSLDSSRKRQFNGVIDVYKKTLQSDGIHGLYRGFSVSCIGLWTHYYMMKNFKPTSSKEKHNQEKPTISGIVVIGMLQQSVRIALYPIDTVRRRMMMTSGEGSIYRGAMDAYYQIVKTEGGPSLFKGVIPFIIHNIAKDLVTVGFVVSMTYLVLQKPAK